MRAMWFVVAVALTIGTGCSKTETKPAKKATGASSDAPDNPRDSGLDRPDDADHGGNTQPGTVDDSTTGHTRPRGGGADEDIPDDGRWDEPHEPVSAMIDAAMNQDRAALARCFHPDCDRAYKAVEDGSASPERIAELFAFLTGIKTEEARIQGDIAVLPYAGPGSQEFRLKQDADGQWKVMGW